MSVLSSLFGKRDLGALQREAEALFQEARFGDAKLAFDRLAARARKEQPALATDAEQRAADCCDRIALARVEEASTLRAGGHHEIAKDELRHALQTARSEATQALVRERLRELEDAAEAASAAPEVAPLGDEEQLMLITGSWDAAQAAELERYGEPLFEALLAIERGEGERAVGLLSPLLAGAPEAIYLWLELGRAQLARQALTDAETALRTFLARLGTTEATGARLTTHRELARIAHERGDRDAAVAELEAAAEALADDPRPYLDLGNYLRLIERPREAIEVLELGVALFPEGAVEWPVTLELGLACAAAGDQARGVTLLESVLAGLLAQGHDDLPPLAAVTLAKLHEESGNLPRAADLYRVLAQGSDVARRGQYLDEAARLVDVLGLTDEASRLRARARALAATPAEP